MIEDSDIGREAGTRPDGIGPFSRRHLLSIAIVALATAGILIIVTLPIGRRPAATEPPQAGSSFYLIGAQSGTLEIGSAPPDFVGKDGTKLTDLSGESVTLEDLRGKPIWVFFFATWCPPCQQETPDIERAWEARRDDVVIIGIDVQEPRELVDEYRRTYGLTYRIGVDTTAAVMETWHVFGLPTHYFIDGNGVIRERQLGPLSLPEMEERIDLIAGTAR